MLRIFLGFICVILTACEPQNQESPHPPKNPASSTRSQLERIQKTGILTVLTRYDQTTYYETANGFSGLEYDLVQLFAKHLHVKVKFIIPPTFAEILRKTKVGEADFAAAGLSITKTRQQSLLFTPPYQSITEQVIYRMGNKRPKNIDDLTEGILEIVKNTSHAETLQQLQENIPELQWNTNDLLDTDGLLYLINEYLIDYTIADSNQITLLRRFYPKLNVAFNIGQPRQLAWAFTKSIDLSLYHEAVEFFKRIKEDKTLNQLIARHYGHAQQTKYVGNCTFQLHLKTRLPAYQALFEQAAKKYGFDWRLLAAISYQESHWNKKAVSPTGVKGLMMLTQATANQLGIKNRVHPAESINGGALYLKQRIKKIPRRIPEPDRTWFGLASYNIGFGHLEDARIITQRLGKDPDKWIDVKESLPLLTQKKWYSMTKHGYSRGKEPVLYVANIRNYFDLLIWHTSNKKRKEEAAMKPFPLTAFN